MKTLFSVHVVSSFMMQKAVAQSAQQRLHISSNQYSWTVYLNREGANFMANPEVNFRLIKQAGLDGLEPIVNSPDEVRAVGRVLKKLGLEMRSIYVGSVLHEQDKVASEIARILSIAETAKEFGTCIIVTNPAPAGQQGKNDLQLITQAQALDELGGRLRELGVKLAYHHHDVELLHAAREFHHMMLATSPENLSLCLDAHWVYRGAGNSQVALLDVLKLYGHRVSEIHVRQSKDGVWSEEFTAHGDIDYAAVFKGLKDKGARPLIVLEQAVEAGTPHSLDTLTCFRRSSQALRQLLHQLQW